MTAAGQRRPAHRHIPHPGILPPKGASIIMSIFSSFLSRRRAAKASRPSIPVFAVYRAADGQPSGDPLYYSSTRASALSYVSRRIQISRAAHYSEWCRLHGLQPGFPSDSWDLYLQTVVLQQPDACPDPDASDSGSVSDASDASFPPDASYAVAEALLSPNDLASFMRMLSACAPAFSPDETDAELVAYLASSGQDGISYAHSVCQADPSLAPRVNSALARAAKADRD